MSKSVKERVIMNVYDWDKTIYDGDSSIDFYKFNLRKDKKLSKLWLKQTKAAADYKRGKISKTEMKTVFYEYFKEIEDIDLRVLEFWAEHKHKIKQWYFDQRRDDDLIISASPEFLLEPIVVEELGLSLIASRVDKYTGAHDGENCYAAEKVRRMRELYDLSEMESFYSDSYSDDPLAQYAKASYFVVGNDIKPW